MVEEKRNCPYCDKVLKTRPYWKHVQNEHPAEYESDHSTWTQLFLDYTSMGMDKSITISVISELFNKPHGLIEDYLHNEGVLD